MTNALIIGALSAIAAVLAGTAIAASKPAVATVSTARTGLGQILVDGRGRSLYLFEKDTRSRSGCSGTCVVYWPPLLTKGASAAVGGAKRSLLGSIRRGDGTRQVTYAGHPLYLFSGDAKRGQTNGEGLKDFGAAWYAVAPSGKKIDRD
jgi:predicted lipoprotein with Yx(FWY)xxD motif